MRLFYYILILLINSVLYSHAITESNQADILYGNTPDFWGTVENLDEKKDNIKELDRYLDPRYGKNELGLSHFEFSAFIPQKKIISDIFPFFKFHIRGDALAGGEVLNPVFPQIKAYQSITGEGGFGLYRPIKYTDNFEIGSSFGFQFGTGELKTLEMHASDFIEKTPIQKGDLNFVTFNFSFGFTQLMFDHFRSEHTLNGLPTFLNYHVTEQDLKPGWKEKVWKARWNYIGKWFLSTDEYANENGFHLGVLSSFGNFPIPNTSLLPKSWEYVHDRSLTNSFTKMSGVGMFGQVFFDPSSLYFLELQAGTFAGLFGGSGSLRLNWFYLEAGSWGLDTGVRYLIEETRLSYGKIGIVL